MRSCFIQVLVYRLFMICPATLSSPKGLTVSFPMGKTISPFRITFSTSRVKEVFVLFKTGLFRVVLPGKTITLSGELTTWSLSQIFKSIAESFASTVFTSVCSRLLFQTQHFYSGNMKIAHSQIKQRYYYQFFIA